MLTCTRRLTFEAGHRVFGHENKCAHFHGHSYKALITADGNLDAQGRIIDFSVLKAKIGGWIDAQWDHATLLNAADPFCALWQPGGPLAGQRHFLLPYNPTAENLAHYLLNVVAPQALHDTSVYVKAVVVWETENCSAEARKGA